MHDVGGSLGHAPDSAGFLVGVYGSSHQQGRSMVWIKVIGGSAVLADLRLRPRIQPADSSRGVGRRAWVAYWSDRG